jgi:hypothetical protein
MSCGSFQLSVWQQLAIGRLWREKDVQLELGIWMDDEQWRALCTCRVFVKLLLLGRVGLTHANTPQSDVTECII